MEKKQITGYDDTKKMLNTLRKLNESRTSFNTLREQSEPQQSQINPESMENDGDEVSVINDVDVKLVSTDSADLKLMEDQKTAISGLIDSFRNEVSQIADLKPGITMNETQIRLDGSITDNDINFVYIVGDEPGLYINADMLMVDNDTLTELTKLLKFEATFKTSMEPLLRQRKTN
jgi:hypothetical protein